MKKTNSKSERTSLRDLDELVRLSNLYDFYGPLLKERHRAMFEEYVLDDYSLSEIAGKYEITRQGVYDVIKRCSNKLEKYEEDMQLFAKFQEAKGRLEKIQSVVETDISMSDEDRTTILRMTDEILDSF